MNKGKYTLREVKRQAKNTFSRQKVAFFFVSYCPSTLLKCLLDICEVWLKREEYLILQTVHTRLQKSRNKKRHYGMAHFGILTS